MLLARSSRRVALRFVLNQVIFEALSDVLLLPLRQLLFHLIECEMHHIVVMQLLRSDEIA